MRAAVKANDVLSHRQNVLCVTNHFETYRNIKFEKLTILKPA